MNQSQALDSFALGRKINKKNPQHLKITELKKICKKG